MRYLSVCSGIEAASVAWHSLGWECVGVSEIDPFASAVLAERYPHVPNLGDMTAYRDWSIDGGAVDLLVGGTPCQAFSVAGLRRGLDDPRGNLTLVYLGLVDHFRPRWCVWENVPGVLSIDGGRAFGSFLGGLAQLGYGFAYRVLDAQYVRVDEHPRAVPQRRRRVFVVGRAGGDARRAARVLLEPEGRSGNPPTRRASRTSDAARATGRATKDASLALDTRVCQFANHSFNTGEYVVESSHGFATQETSGTITTRVGELDTRSVDRGEYVVEVAPAVTAKWSKGSGGPAGDECQNLVAFGIRRDATREGVARTPSLDAHGRLSLRNPGLGISMEVAPTLDATGPHTVAVASSGGVVAQRATTEVMGTLQTRTGRLQAESAVSGELVVEPCIGEGAVFQARAYTRDNKTAGKLRSDTASVITAGTKAGDSEQLVVQPLPFDPTQITHPANRSNPQPGDPSPTLTKDARPPHIAFKSSYYTRGKDGAPSDVAPPLTADADRGDQDTLVLASLSTLAVGLDDVSHTLTRSMGTGASEDGTGRGVPIVATSWRYPQDVADPITSHEQSTWTHEGKTFRTRNLVPGSVVAPTLTAANNPSRSPQSAEVTQQVAAVYEAAHAVRRLTPRECERLQGFPDDWTAVTYRKKPAADGPRYKAIGNSMAVNVMRWIGLRIDDEERSNPSY